MDVGNPSNFARMLDLFQGDFENLSNEIVGYAFTDEETQVAMREVFSRHKYVMDPHGAVAYLGLKEFLKSGKYDFGVFLETAHPAKFKDVVDETLNTSVAIPQELQEFLQHPKKSIPLSKDYQSFKTFLNIHF